MALDELMGALSDLVQRIREQPWAREGSVIVIPALSASLAADHRVSDGHRGALFLARIRDLLQQPDQL